MSMAGLHTNACMPLQICVVRNYVWCAGHSSVFLEYGQGCLTRPGVLAVLTLLVPVAGNNTTRVRETHYVPALTPTCRLCRDSMGATVQPEAILSLPSERHMLLQVRATHT